MFSKVASFRHDKPAETALFTRLTIFLLIVFSLVIVAERLFFPSPPISRDPAAYAIISQEVLHGKDLYTDIWDHKPPGVFLVYGVLIELFGYSADVLYILNIFIDLFILLGIFLAGGLGPGQRFSGAIAAALWVVLSGSLMLEGRDPNTEVFLNACLVWAMVIFLQHRKTGLGTFPALLVGLCFAVGSLFKPVLIANALFLVLAHMISGFVKERSGKGLWADGIKIAAVGAVFWMVTICYFAATGRADVFIGSVFTYNSFYSGDLVANIFAPLNGRAEIFSDFLNPLALLMSIGVVLTYFYESRKALLLATLAASTWIAIALPGRFYVHYYQLWLPALIIGSAWAIGFLTHSESKWPRRAAYASGILVVLITVWGQAGSYKTLLAEDWQNYSDAPLVAARSASDKVDQMLEPGETFFFWGNVPNLYYLANRRPPAAVLFEQHLSGGPIAEQLAQRVADDLARERPELLVRQTDRRPVPEWISRDYEPIPIATVENSFEIYRRKGGRLANSASDDGSR